MAFVGLSKPYIASLKDEATPTYEKGFKCGKAMTLNVTPNYNEASLYADNQRVAVFGIMKNIISSCFL